MSAEVIIICTALTLAGAVAEALEATAGGRVPTPDFP